MRSYQNKITSVLNQHPTAHYELIVQTLETRKESSKAIRKIAIVIYRREVCFIGIAQQRASYFDVL